MRLHRFHLKTPILKDDFDIADRDIIHQWRNVFRYNVGSQVILFDGSGTDFLCIITSLRNTTASLSVLKRRRTENSAEKNIWLCVSIIKKDNFEWIVEKATELGVNHIVPIISERSEKKNLNMERLEKIAKESSEQSWRGEVPKIHDIIDLDSAINSNVLPKEKIVLSGDGKYVAEAMSKIGNILAVFVGPEGGYSSGELERFDQAGIVKVSLGPRTLKTETAVIAISSLLLL
jgi:16S rRNA (uracil1498-N3)-methyltransferase